MQSKHQSFLTRNYATTALFIPPQEFLAPFLSLGSLLPPKRQMICEQASNITKNFVYFPSLPSVYTNYSTLRDTYFRINCLLHARLHPLFMYGMSYDLETVVTPLPSRKRGVVVLFFAFGSSPFLCNTIYIFF